MFGSKTEAVTNWWSELHNEELCNLYFASDFKGEEWRTCSIHGRNYKCCSHDLKGRIHLGGLSRDNVVLK